MKMKLSILIVMFVILATVSVALANPEYPNPRITSAGCDWLVMQWDNPPVEVDTYSNPVAYLRPIESYDLYIVEMKTLREYPDFVWSVYIGDIVHNGEWLVDGAYVPIEDGKMVWAENTPYQVNCKHIHLPAVFSEY